ncbi:hypothetical protein NGA_0613200 [Nannochloropsis gaditana CCMP526]|nr:hypothetical protein NGA_0613200 [Nannochloropsis gaditana CCMP526]EKU20750.1 hypothetical protein NGA_0613200 [Nannochloropsis gaditana CCMP526]|eukprot:XP_005855619.1 hypothetical protein NGA_0613200 [Nannochloropsis gaditana CCMP526]
MSAYRQAGGPSVKTRTKSRGQRLVEIMILLVLLVLVLGLTIWLSTRPRPQGAGPPESEMNPFFPPPSPDDDGPVPPLGSEGQEPAPSAVTPPLSDPVSPSQGAGRQRTLKQSGLLIVTGL